MNKLLTKFVVLFAIILIGCAKDRATSSATMFSQSYSGSQHSALDRYRAEANNDSASSSSGSVVHNKNCPVTGEPVDSMGGAILVSANGYKISVCCHGCVSAVQKDPATYLALAQSQNNGGSIYPSISYRASGGRSGKCH